MNKTVVTISIALAALLLFPNAGMAKIKSDTGNHLKLNGEVSKIQSGVIFAKTSWGSMSIGTQQKLNDVKVGDRVVVVVDEDHSVIDVHRPGEEGFHHRLVSGHLVYTTSNKDAIRLWTPEGKNEFPVDAVAVAKLNGIQEGEPVTVEINEDGKVVDVTPLTLSFEVREWAASS